MKFDCRMLVIARREGASGEVVMRLQGFDDKRRIWRLTDASGMIWTRTPSEISALALSDARGQAFLDAVKARRGRATPADVKVIWPTTVEILRAMVCAAEVENCDAIELLQGEGSPMARLYAALALAQAYPTAPREPLARKLGQGKAFTLARLRFGNHRNRDWFSLVKLNAVRAACGWAAMTWDEAALAGLIYCGQPWEDFVDRTAIDRVGVTDSGVDPVAGSGGDEKPAPIEAKPGVVAGVRAEPAASLAETVRRHAEPEPPVTKPGRQRAYPAPRKVELHGGILPEPFKRSVSLATGPQIKNDTQGQVNVEAGRVLTEVARERTANALDDEATLPISLRVRRGRRVECGEETAAFCGDPPPGRSALAQRARP